VDANKAKTLSDAARENLPAKPADNKNAATAPTTLADAKQKLTGDLWLDTASGQLVRVEMAIQTQLHTKGEVKNKAGKTRPTENWADFDGALQMQLRKVSYANGTPEGAQ
jgi:hypothetical protein